MSYTKWQNGGWPIRRKTSKKRQDGTRTLHYKFDHDIHPFHDHDDDDDDDDGDGDDDDGDDDDDETDTGSRSSNQRGDQSSKLRK